MIVGFQRPFQGSRDEAMRRWTRPVMRLEGVADAADERVCIVDGELVVAFCVRGTVRVGELLGKLFDTTTL